MKQDSQSQLQSLPREQTLYITFELSNKKWKLGFSNRATSSYLPYFRLDNGTAGKLDKKRQNHQEAREPMKTESFHFSPHKGDEYEHGHESPSVNESRGASVNLFTHFPDLPDPSIDRTKRHKLIDIVGISICAVICGADGWAAIEEYGQAKETWLREFFELPHGIPSDDTFRRVFTCLAPSQFQDHFVGWVQAISRVGWAGCPSFFQFPGMGGHRRGRE